MPKPQHIKNFAAKAVAAAIAADNYYNNRRNTKTPYPTAQLRTFKPVKNPKKGPPLDLRSKDKLALSTALRMRFRGRRGSRTKRFKRRRTRTRGYYLKRRKNAWMYRIRPEIKEVEDISTASTPLGLYNVAATSSGHVLLNSANTGRSFTPRIAQGTGKNQRIGETVLMKTLHCRFRFQTQANYVGPLKVKIYIFYKPTDTTVANAMADFIEYDPLLLPVNTIYSPMSSRASHTYQQYRILREEDVWIREDNTAGSARIVIEKEININLKGKTLRMKPGGNDFEHGDIGCLLLCSDGVHAAPTYTALDFTWATTLYYVDP